MSVSGVSASCGDTVGTGSVSRVCRVCRRTRVRDGRNFDARRPIHGEAVGAIDAATDDAPPSLPPWSRSSRRCHPYPWCSSQHHDDGEGNDLASHGRASSSAARAFVLTHQRRRSTGRTSCVRSTRPVNLATLKKRLVFRGKRYSSIGRAPVCAIDDALEHDRVVRAFSDTSRSSRARRRTCARRRPAPRARSRDTPTCPAPASGRRRDSCVSSGRANTSPRFRR